MDAGPIQLVDARDPDWLALHSQRRHAVGPASGRSLAVPQPSRARPFIAARSILSLTPVRAVSSSNCDEKSAITNRSET